MKIKQIIITIKWMPTDIINKVVFKIRRIKYGVGMKSFGTIFVRKTGTITIGNDVMITSCRETNPIGGDVKTILYAKNGGRIQIGNRVGISNTSLIAMNSIVIEDNVMIGASCKLYDHDFHSISYEKRVASVDDDVQSKPILIKEGAFIGAHCIILKGVTIGRRSVVGAGSVVTKNIPDNEVWAGNPAKFIKKVL